MEQGSKRPDSPKLARATVRAAVGETARLVPELALIAGGTSFGGRMTSQAQDASPLPGILGLVFLGFPLHPAGLKPPHLPVYIGINQALCRLRVEQQMIDAKPSVMLPSVPPKMPSRDKLSETRRSAGETRSLASRQRESPRIRGSIPAFFRTVHRRSGESEKRHDEVATVSRRNVEVRKIWAAAGPPACFSGKRACRPFCFGTDLCLRSTPSSPGTSFAAAYYAFRDS